MPDGKEHGVVGVKCVTDQEGAILNPEQKRVVECTEGVKLVVSGPGTG